MTEETPPRTSPLVVLAIRDTHADRGRDGLRPVSIGALPAFDLLVEEGRQKGIRIIREAEWDRSEVPSALLWDLASFAVLPRHLTAVDPSRRIGFCLESPLIAHRAYHRLHRIADECAHLFLFPGAKAMVPSSGAAEFHPLYWPNNRLEQQPVSDWAERRFLVMVATNKRAHRGWDALDVKNPYQTLRRTFARMLASTYALRGKWQAPDLYKLRLEAIEHFSKTADFDLFGLGWERPVPNEERYRPALEKSYRGAVASKLPILRNYRFSLCFENTIFPGYITEKIFDCFMSGTIPVYVGAPDISEYVPHDSYVDGSGRSFVDIEKRIRKFSQRDAEGTMASITEFLVSEAFNRFTAHHFVHSLLSVLRSAIVLAPKIP